MSEYRWPAPELSESLVATIATTHGLIVGPNGKELIAEQATDYQALLVEMDVAFARLNPAIPAENVCARFDNYMPQTDSQQSFMESAAQLVQFNSPVQLAGFIACGGAGVGKTHIAVAAAKSAMMDGQKTFYVNAPTAPYSPKAVDKAAASDIVIIDDLNSNVGGGFTATQLQMLLGVMHNRGGG